MKWRHAWDEKADAIERAATNIECLDESLTIQDAPNTDINQLLKRMGVTDGSVLPGALGVIDPRHYGDWDDALTLKDALDRSHEAERTFMLLPAELRTQFQNDPYALWEFVNDPKNIDEAVDMGLLHRDAQKPKEEDSPPPPPKADNTN